MSKADEMFDYLGYVEETKYMDRSIVECLYKKDCDGVRFYKDRTFEVIKSGSVRSITIPLLKAINQKCIELGWLDETSNDKLHAARKE